MNLSYSTLSLPFFISPHKNSIAKVRFILRMLMKFYSSIPPCIVVYNSKSLIIVQSTYMLNPKFFQDLCHTVWFAMIFIGLPESHSLYTGIKDYD